MSHIVAPSILSADFGNLQQAFQLINQSQADWFHVDVMDGVFVPNISFGFPVMKTLKKVAQKPLDVHLMIVQPERYIQEFANAGADILTVHFEACTHLHRTLGAIKEAGMKAGVAINPHTPISSLKDILYMADLVCMMSVNPGFGGQKFIQNTYSKIKELKELSKSQNLHPYIEIDGGVTLENAKSLIDAGANVLVAGNTVFSAPNPIEAIAALKNV
ncbi:MAG: ribulose-phosphate 3-epimerase [Bacteroidia bacterium]|nr:ribulose-phosphate 3-epimerase [Bacteroidia bacterium]